VAYHHPGRRVVTLQDAAGLPPDVDA